jgi:hypothetical protein
MKRPFHNETSQAERRAILDAERSASTYHQFATSEADPVHDRFEEISGSSVTGATRYLPQPETSPWASDSVGQEPPLGFPIDQMEPTGTHTEIEQSLREASSPPTKRNRRERS